MAISFSLWHSLQNIFTADHTVTQQDKYNRSPSSAPSVAQSDRRSCSVSPRSQPTSHGRGRERDRDRSREDTLYLPTPPSTGTREHRHRHQHQHQTPMATRKIVCGKTLTPQRNPPNDQRCSSSVPKISDKFSSSPSWKTNVNANGDTYIATLERINPDRGFRYDYYEELRISQNKVMELQRAGWPKDATYLFHKISMRGYEPLMPHNWIIDFDTVPLSLFTDKHRGAFIRAGRGSDFRAIHALKTLTSIGCRARDSVRTNRSPEKILHRGIVDYMRWALRDSKLSFTATIPNLVVDANPVDRPASELEARMLKKLGALAARWEMNLRIYDSVEGLDTESPHSSVTNAGPSDEITGSAPDVDSEDDISKAIWRACYVPRRQGHPLSSSSSGCSSSASFEPGSSIDHTISSYSYSNSNSNSNSSRNTNGTNTPSSSVTLPGHARYTHALPTLYGIIISHTVVAIVAYDPNSTTTYSSLSPSYPSTVKSSTLISLPHSPSSLVPPCLRTISFFDFGDEKYDVWNALALAIIVVHCRNALLDLEHDGVDVEDVGEENVGDEAETEMDVEEE